MARRRTVYMGIDPGLAKTGVVICTKSRAGKLKLEHAEVIQTSSKQSLQTRYSYINDELGRLIREHGVTHVVCEAYEVRTYIKPMNSSVAMSKLINSVSSGIFYLGIPFLLSSPDIRKHVSSDEIPEFVKTYVLSLPKYKREHILDAWVHVYYHFARRD